MGTEKVILRDAYMEIRVWSNPDPVSIIVVPMNGYNIGDDEEVTLELTPSDLKQLSDLLEKSLGSSSEDAGRTSINRRSSFTLPGRANEKGESTCQ